VTAQQGRDDAARHRPKSGSRHTEHGDLRAPIDLAAELARLTPSTDPAVVFRGVAAATVPTFAEGCFGDVTTGDTTYRILASSNKEHIGSAARSSVTDGAGELSLPFSEPGFAGLPGYEGSLCWAWTQHDRPSDWDTLLARLVIEHATDLVRQARLSLAVELERMRTSNLKIALESNREIGQAIGILMATQQLTSDGAFELLRTVSLQKRRKLRLLAAEVCETGTLRIPDP
jgi:hypothetical protein